MDISPYISGHKEQLKYEDMKREEFFNMATSKAKEIAQALMKNYPGVQVWLFGSLTTELFELNSDIDLAIKGLLEDDYFKALKIAEDLAANIPIDLVQVEYAPETLRERIEREGVSL